MFRRSSQKAPPCFSHRWDGAYVELTLVDGDKRLAPNSWSSIFPVAVCAIADIEGAATDALLAKDGTELVILNQDAARLHSEFVASLDALSSSVLGLPPTTPLGLDLKPVGRIDQDDFYLQTRWVRPGGQPVRVSQQGPFLKIGDNTNRIPQPLWNLYSAALALAKPTDKASRFEHLSRLKDAWPDDPRIPLDSEPYLQELRVHYASAVSLKLQELRPDHTDFDPVLFGVRAVEGARDAGHEPDEEIDNILTPAAQRIFAGSRFRQDKSARPVYVLRDGEYVFIDPALRPVLNVVRHLQDAPEKERREFVLNPRRIIQEKLGAEVAGQADIGNVFVETEQFSERVAGVDVWRKSVLPWLVPSTKNQWLPERFGLRIADDYFIVSAEKVTALADKVEAAVSEGQSSVDLSGLLEPATREAPEPPYVVPANEATLRAVASLTPFANIGMSDVEQAEFSISPGWDTTKGKLFLVVRDNFEEVAYTPFSPANEEQATELPQLPLRVRTKLKPHQQEGFAWLAESSQKKQPGALLADDMGLGKTVQALSFMAWLQDQATTGSRTPNPFLIVAPTGLLGTWKKEIAAHLDERGLGLLIPAFGGDLISLKEEDSFGARDIETGRASLRNEDWRNAGVVLTTYETLRDYHFSFARTRFGLIVFDEIQKLKNPVSQVTRAAKALNAEFLLGMTGTPVENRLQDLWSIIDVVIPGLLGSSRDFEKRYSPENKDALATLKQELTDRKDNKPAHILRRMKADQLKEMPAKHVHKYQVDMPPRQANSYRDVVVRAAAAASAGTLAKGGMLSTLAAMRGISLHPIDPRQCPSDIEEYARDSARLSKVLQILTDIAAKSEKALIFVEDLAMQERLAGLLQKHFSLKSAPLRINGAVSGQKRQEIVDRFEINRDRFDVMILSPKAGGVGLTITSANHVIHLSRWWNPAVEDQATDRVFRIGQTRDVHVYLPMAAHPDPDIRASSFDLRLDALIDRKKALTRDLFFPPEPNDGDLERFFQEVSLTRAPEEVSGVAGDGQAYTDTTNGSEKPQPASQPAEASRRQLLTLPKAVVHSGIRRWRLNAGEARPTAEVTALFVDKKISLVAIRDPYALGNRRARQAQIRFIEELKAACRSLDAVTVEYAPDTDDEPDSLKCQSFTREFQKAFQQGAPRLLLTPRLRKTADDDFHDRFVDIDVKTADGGTRRHEISIGRGLEALFNPRWQCTVTYAPPGSY